VFDLDFNYRSAPGKLKYWAQTTCPDIMYATHQIAKYSSDPGQLHGEAILYLICYLKKTLDLDLYFNPDSKKGFECYFDADFSGLWNKAFAPANSSTYKPQIGLFSMQDALSLGPPNFNPKLLCPLLKLSILQCHKFYMMPFLSWNYYRT
jgi:hypothetical protein